MLRKKYVVQKSLRIDAKLSEDLERLAKILDRPQSELINFAIENLIIENKAWFAKYIFVDMLEDMLKKGDGAEHCEVNSRCIKNSVSIRMDWDKSFVLNWELRDGINHENLIDSLEMEYPGTDEAFEQLINKLIEIAEYNDETSTEVQNYLKQRLDYK